MEEPIKEKLTKEEPKELSEPLKTKELPKINIKGAEKVFSSNLEDDLKVLLTKSQKIDLTDGGATTLHKHDHGTLDGLDDDDHSAVYLAKDNTNSYTPTDDYHPATKKYVDDSASMIPSSYTAGDVFIAGDGAEDHHFNTYWTKVAEFTIDKGGTLRLKFDLRIASGGTASEAYAKVYRNGAAVGSTWEDDSSATYASYSEDISGWSPGDLVQLYSITSDSSYAVYTRKFRACVAEDIYLPPITPGYVDVTSAPTERSSSEVSYTLIKELEVLESGTYRISWEMRSDGAGENSYAKIYKNGVAFGSEQVVSNASYVTKAENLTFSKGDSIELWVHVTYGSERCYIKNFKASVLSLRGVSMLID
ncbi:MAG: hypothetical protein DRZ76_02595 [Candidatus Nealsonbacteria bacterium]|nr:MAG: hypothetical protein DRZ76_02595 [Candidatus Nealsonbacteria bacterium]